MISNKVYDVLKWICLVCIPAFSTFLFSLSCIFHWDWGEIAVGVLTAVDTFLGALIGVSTVQYNKGQKDEDSKADN